MTGGSVARSFPMVVEAGAVARFARALGYPDAAGGGPPAPAVAPPSFVMAADDVDPGFDRRPRPGEPWLGSGSRPTGLPPGSPEPEGLFHVGQEIAVARHLVVGERVTVHRHEPRTWTKQGRRGGQLTFVETTTEVVGADGAVAVTSTWLDVATETSHAQLTAAQAQGPTDAPAWEPPPGAISTVLVDDLTRTQIAMYVGAAGDWHPLHHDDVFARHRGLPGVFAPGMLTLGLTARAVTDHVGEGGLRGIGGRFAAQVWPGDTLVAHLVPPGDAGGRLTVTTVNQHGAVVFDGWAAT